MSKPLPACVPAAIYAAEQAATVIAALADRRGRVTLTRDLLLKLLEAAHLHGQQRAFGVWVAHGKTEAEIRAQFDSEST